MQADQNAVLEHMSLPESYPHPTENIRRIETHISCVYLTGPFAYKIKKAVTLPYLDFSTLNLRERACRDELDLNRRLAAKLYHDVVSIGGSRSDIRVGGKPVLEYAVKITQFPDRAIADELIQDGRLAASELSELADDIAAFHLALPAVTADSAIDRIHENLSELERTLDRKSDSQLNEISAWLQAEMVRLSPLFSDRNRSGKMRECHGDLHLGNIVKVENRLIAFDCLEFSRDLRTIDLIDEAAFLFMDLLKHQRNDLAFTFLNRYLSQSGEYSALELIRIYVAHRALVRAKVAATGLSQGDQRQPIDKAAEYLDVASAQVRMRRPICIITSGLSGSGKSTIANALVPRLPAIHIRSDVERKRLYGMQARQRSRSELKQGIYNSEATDKTYRHLTDCAAAALQGGFNVIIDASFIDREQRNVFRHLARRLKSGFVVLHCHAPPTVLRARILERRQQQRDASEADLEVLAHQIQVVDPFDKDEQKFVVQVTTTEPFNADQLSQQIGATGT